MANVHPRKLPTTSSEGNAALLQLAHDRLDQIHADMESRQEFGTVGIELTYDRGQISMVRRTLNGTDRPAR